MSYERVLVGVDGSSTSMKALELAASVARSEGAELLVLTARAKSADTDRVLADAQAATGSDGLAVRTLAETGPAVDVILDVAEREDVDLIVLGNKGMHGTKRFLLGSVPDEISHRAPCDVLIARTS